MEIGSSVSLLRLLVRCSVLEMMVLKDSEVIFEGLSKVSLKMPSSAPGLPAGSFMFNNYSVGKV